MHSYIPLSGAIQFNQDLLIAFIFIIVHMQVSNYLISVIFFFSECHQLTGQLNQWWLQV